MNPDQLNKINRYLANINEQAKDQVIRFLLEDNKQNCNKAFILRQIEEMAIMYPELRKLEE